MLLHGKVKGNKYWEFQLDKFSSWNSYFEFHIEWTTRTDHSGFKTIINICGWLLFFGIYDCSHWDSEKGEWCKYNKEEQ